MESKLTTQVLSLFAVVCTCPVSALLSTVQGHGPPGFITQLPMSHGFQLSAAKGKHRREAGRLRKRPQVPPPQSLSVTMTCSAEVESPLWLPKRSPQVWFPPGDTGAWFPPIAPPPSVLGVEVAT